MTTMTMTTIRRLLSGLFTAFTIFTVSAQQSDFGIWVNLDAEYKFAKKFELQFSGAARSFNNTSELEQAFLEGGVQYNIRKFLSVAASYRLITKLEENGFYYTRHKFFADVTGTLPIGNFSISGRVKLQRTVLTYFEKEEDRIARYHLRLRIKGSWRPSTSPFKPFISFEPFIPVFKGSEPSIGKYRLSAGSELFITQKSSIDIGYILERDFKPVLVNLHVLNIGYKIKF